MTLDRSAAVIAGRLACRTCLWRQVSCSVLASGTCWSSQVPDGEETEDHLLAGRGAARLSLCLADRFLHWTVASRVVGTCDGGHGTRSSAVRLGLDRYAEPPFCCQAIRPRAHQLPCQPESFRLCHCRDLLRHRDLAEGDSDIDRYEGRTGNGLALGCPSQPVLGGRGASGSV